MKTEIYNLIILDESGSMDCVKSQTISGCNETINTIRSAQEKFAGTQEHYVSIYAFQADGHVPSRYIVKNEPIANVRHINGELYAPWGSTPLYDAVGSTLVDLKATVKGKEMAIGNVTIITDGMENASRHYTLQKVAKMIDELKELGWSFNFIGANIDVKGTAASLNIDNSMEFQQDAVGTQMMFARERSSRMRWMERTNEVMMEADYCAAPTGAAPDCEKSKGKRKNIFSRLRDAAANYFEEEDKK